MSTWAKCKECGGEVVFDAWIHLGGAVHSAYENNLCTECDGKDVDYTEEEDNEEGATEPNDTLIATAPELLAALKIAVVVMKDHNLDESMSGEFEQFTDAINKAEGRSE